MGIEVILELNLGYWFFLGRNALLIKIRPGSDLLYANFGAGNISEFSSNCMILIK